MNILPKSVKKVIDEFSKLPGIGPKTASRLTFYLLSLDAGEIDSFGESLLGLKNKLRKCSVCLTITEDDLCAICADKKRDQTEIMLVAEPLDIVALERTGFMGRYHVLGGVISPIDGIGPEDLSIDRLLDKLAREFDTLKEVIIATDPSLEGEATAMYILREINKAKEKNKINNKVLVTRIAHGLPVGGDVEYADEVTLSRAIEGRREFD